MIDIISPMIKQFLPFAQERMGFKKAPKLFLRGDNKNADNPLGKTAFYDPSGKSVTIYITGRHPKDVMRSLSHELVHHTQNCRGDFDNVEEMGEGYAQNDEHLREMEREAYEIGNMCFRDWEDSIKSTIYFEHLQKGANKTMSFKEWKNGELTTLLGEAWGFNFDLQPLSEIGAKDTGASKDDESKTDPGEKDYTTKKREKKTTNPDQGEKKVEEAGRPHSMRGGRTMADLDKDAKTRETDFLKKKEKEKEENVEEGGRANRKENDPQGEERRMKTSSAMRERRISEEQIRQVARKIVARMKETTNNG